MTVSIINIHTTNNSTSSDSLSDIQQDLKSKSVCIVLNLSVFQFHDESKDVMSAKTSNIFNNVIYTICFPALFFVGFPSNIINIVVFFKHGLKQRINLCLFCLSLMDLIFVTLAFLLYVDKLGDKDFTISFRKVGLLMEIIVNNKVLGFFSGSVFSSQFVSAVISGERCLCVVWPLQTATVLKTKHLAVVLLVGILPIYGTRFLVAMKHYVVCIVDAVTGITSYQLIPSEFYRVNKKLIDILDGILNTLGVPLVLCTFVIITTVVTAVNLRKSTQFQRDSSLSSRVLSERNLAVTKMLIYLSIQFIVLNTPNILVRLSMFCFHELKTTGNWANLYFFLASITMLCGVLSSSLNFLVYYFCGSKYRETVLQMLCKRQTVRSSQGS